MFRIARLRASLPRPASLSRSYASMPPPPPSKPLLLAGVLAAGGLGYFAVSQLTAFEKAKPAAVPVMAKGEAVDTSTPVPLLTLDEANARLRGQARTFTFQGKDGAKGRVDLVRLDSNTRVEDEWDLRTGDGVDGNSTLFAGVYDGHAGWAMSAVLRKALVPCVSAALASVSSPEAVDTTIKAAFTKLDDKIAKTALDSMNAGHGDASGRVIADMAPAIAGSCALLTMYDLSTGTLRTAVTGDSRAVLGSWSAEKSSFEAHALSKDQTGFNEDEVNRLDKAHPGEKDIIDKKSGRLIGIAITRAFGDHRWKWSVEDLDKANEHYFSYGKRPNYKTPPYMTAEPEITTRQVQGQDFVIMASDGLWDVISNEHAVECVERWVKAKKAGKPETVVDKDGSLTMNKYDEASYKATPEFFAIEDMDSAAVCLLKNALGGNRRDMFRGIVGSYAPLSRYVRDDITIQVIFFDDPTK